jgi:hypothetical protein
MRRLFVLAAMLVPMQLVAVAHASQLIDRNATAVKLAVNGKGEALLTYQAGGKLKRVLAWGAVNASPSQPGAKQAEFQLDYSGGGRRHGGSYWQSFGTSCGPYDGPQLAWAVAACTAPDGTNWALQSWQRALPNYGVAPSARQSVWELHLSHWTGELPVLTIKVDWAYRRFDHLYGSFTYGGKGVYGFSSTPAGVPLDDFGRNLYVDTFDSAYGSGWRRENSFLTHASKGLFCYGFYPHGGHPVGKGSKYRATIMGPGVTPVVMWEGAAPGPYDKARDDEANAEQRAAYADKDCKVN